MQSEVIEFGPFKVHPARRLLLKADKPIRLGSRAFDLLLALAERAGEIVTKDELFARVWPQTFVEETNLRVHIAALRKALGDGRGQGRMIENLPGRGYSFVAEVRRSAVPESRVQTPASRSRPGALPHAVARMFGRDDTVRDLVKLLPERRMVTLVGPGGIGKTTVALAVARELEPAYEHGVAFVDLTTVRDSAQLVTAVATAAGLSLGPGDPSTELANVLRDQHRLLVLDCCEHVVDSVASLAEALVRAALTLHVLATSREPLRAGGEWVQRLPGLDVPAATGPITQHQVLSYAAVQLFVDRASACLGGYALTAADAPIVAEICRRLDGIALAIELAAGRLDTIPIRTLARSLEDCFKILTRGRRTSLPRHQTLRATLDWSYGLLSAEEQAALRCVSMFSGTFTMSAARAVVADAVQEVEEALTGLVAKSLVVGHLSEDEPRFRLLDTTRVYAREKLGPSGEGAGAAARHARLFRGLFEEAEAEWETKPTSEWLKDHVGDLGDLRSALEWAFSPSGDAEVAVALTAASVPLLFHLSLVDESLGWVPRALELVDGLPTDTRRWRMKLLAVLGFPRMVAIAGPQSGPAAWRTCLELAQELGDTDFQLRAIWALQADANNRGQHRVALEFAERFQALARATGDPAEIGVAERMRARALHFLGDQAGAHQASLRMLDRYVAPSKRSHMIRYVYEQRIVARITLQQVLWARGFPDQALRDLEENIALAQSLGHNLTLAQALAHGACPLALLTGHLDWAERFTTLLEECTADRALDVWKTYADCYRGELLVRRGELASGLRHLRPSVEKLRSSGFVLHLSAFVAPLAGALARNGEIAEALAVLDDRLLHCERSGEAWFSPELNRVKGEILLLTLDSSAEAEDLFLESRNSAGRQGALSLELRACMSIARLWLTQDRASEAHGLLGSVLGRFTEGFGTEDLMAGAELLNSIGSHAGPDHEHDGRRLDPKRARAAAKRV